MLQAVIDIESHLSDVPIRDIGVFTSNTLGVVLQIAGLATFGYLVFGGIEWITAGSDTKKIESARTRITNAITGLAIVASSWAIFILIDYFFGLNIVKK